MLSFDLCTNHFFGLFHLFSADYYPDITTEYFRAF